MAIVNTGQSIMDVSIQHTGAIDHIFIIALANGLSITDTLEGGRELTFAPAVYNKRVLDTYARKEIVPGNGDILEEPGGIGIGSMAIGVDFTIG